MGSLLVPDELQQGDLVAFRLPSAAIEFEARSDAEFVVGSAVPHDYDLVLGSHSVHTSTQALRQAESRIAAIQTQLVEQGRLCRLMDPALPFLHPPDILLPQRHPAAHNLSP